MGSPRPVETRARISGSEKCVVASTIAFARGERVGRLEDARADEDAVGAQLHAQRRIRRGGDPAGGERDNGQAPVLGHPADELERRLQLLRLGVELLGGERPQAADVAEDRAHVADGVDDVARARLALRADHGRALAQAPQRLAQVATAADEGDAEGPLVDVVASSAGVSTSLSSM